jgi:signal transduction histidine kinase
MLRTIKAGLVAGFALIVGIWLFTGFYFARRMSDLERRSSDINGRYTRAQELLMSVRSQVLLGSVAVRDALLDPDAEALSDYRHQLEESYTAADEALQEYVPVIDAPEEIARVARLRREIADLRETLREVVSFDGLRPDAGMLLRNRIIPKREAVLRVSEELQAMNRSAFVRLQQDVASLNRVAQRRLWQMFGLALGASLAIALGATIHAGRLEDQIRRQLIKDAENTRDLQRLSSQLLTAQEEERRTIARELHDEIGQLLTAIKVELAIAGRADAPGGGPGPLDNARSIADTAVHTVRDMSRLLHPSMLDDLGLAAAVDWYLKGFGRRHGVRIELLQEGMGERLAPEIEATAYRIVQEALTNVARHAQARTCRVYLQRLTNSLLVTIEDDGAGFDQGTVDASVPRGIGLVGIRERVSLVRGSLRMESAPGKGTRLTVELPARARDCERSGASDEARA